MLLWNADNGTPKVRTSPFSDGTAWKTVGCNSSGAAA
jgi:hypothetical protein